MQKKKKKKNLAPSIKRWLAQKREGVAETEVSLSRLLRDAASRPTVPSAGPAVVFTIRFLRPARGITSSHARAGIPVIMCSVLGSRLQARGDAAARPLAEEVKRCASPHSSVDTSLVMVCKIPCRWRFSQLTFSLFTEKVKSDKSRKEFTVMKWQKINKKTKKMHREMLKMLISKDRKDGRLYSSLGDII